MNFAAYQLGRDKAYKVDNIVSDLSAKHANEVVEGCDSLVDRLRSEGELGAKASKRQKKICGLRRAVFFWVLGIVILVIILAAVLGGVLGSVLGNNNNCEGSMGWLVRLELYSNGSPPDNSFTWRASEHSIISPK